FSVTEAETRQKLLRNVKKEVKQIMEEAVTRKFVHADSSHIISFCGKYMFLFTLVLFLILSVLGSIVSL
uniref:Uncharacterized protein n=1 Tax=Periophthalmus magnuspinnatus TaxID=409849 RepID=A0A3B4AUM4_9GOBI